MILLSYWISFGFRNFEIFAHMLRLNEQKIGQIKNYDDQYRTENLGIPIFLY